MFLVPEEYTRDCTERYLDSIELFQYDTRRDETAKQEVARFDEAAHPDDGGIYFYPNIDLDEYDDGKFRVYLDCSSIIDRILPTNHLINFWYPGSCENCELILSLGTIGDRLSAVTFLPFTNFDLCLVAALEPGNDPEVLSAFLRDFMCNTETYTGESFDFFISVTNYQPLLLPRAAVRNGFRALVEEGFVRRDSSVKGYLYQIAGARSGKEVTRIAQRLLAAWEEQKAVPLSENEVYMLVDWHLDWLYEEGNSE